MYQATLEAQRNPRTLYLGDSWVAIGGSVLIVPEPPKLPITIPEATELQYKQLFEAGFTSLVERVEVALEPITEPSQDKILNDNVDIRLTNPKANLRRKRDLPTVPKV